jgi:hypothetical protein
MKVDFIILNADICRCAVLYHILVDQLFLQHQTPNNILHGLSQLQYHLAPKNACLTGNNPITVTAMAASLKNMYLTENTAPFPYQPGYDSRNDSHLEFLYKVGSPLGYHLQVLSLVLVFW